MPEGSGSRFIAVLLGLIFWIYFSLMHESLHRVSKTRLEGTQKAERLLGKFSKISNANLIGSTISLVVISTFSVKLILGFFASDSLFLIIIVCIVVSFLLVVIGTLTKLLGDKRAEQIFILFAPVTQVFLFLFTPIIFIIEALEWVIIKAFGLDSETSQRLTITENELMTMVDAGHEEGVIEDSEKEMIKNIFDFDDNFATDVMTPRTEVVSLSIDATYTEVLEMFRNDFVSRAPVYKDDMDHIIGTLYVKDFIFSDMSEENFDMESLIKPPFFSYESKLTSELFAQMRAESIAMAIILDEYGGTLGLVTVHDLVEEIVGDLSDEYDEKEIVSTVQDEYIVEGGTKIEDFNDITGMNLHSEEYDSIGGFVIELLGAIPEPGDHIEFKDEKDNKMVSFIVEQMDKKRIAKIKIKISEMPIPQSQEEANYVNSEE